MDKNPKKDDDKDEISDQDKKISEMTDEELSAQQNAFVGRFFTDDTAEPTDDKKDDESSEDGDKKDDGKPEETAEEKAERESKEAEEAEAKRKEDEEREKRKKDLPPDIDEFASERKKHVAKPREEPKPAKEPDKDSGLNDEEEYLMPVLAKMGEMDPKYKGLDKQWTDFVVAETLHIKQWMEDNDGESYDADAEDHRAFYAEHQPKYSKADFRRADRQILKDELRQERDAERRDETSKSDAQRLLKESEPKVQVVAHDAVVDFITSADEALGEMADKDKKGRKYFSEETAKKMEESDPLAVDVLYDEAEPLSYMVGELERMSLMPGFYKPDDSVMIHLKHQDRQFAVHKELMKFLFEHESHVLNLPPEDTIRDGRKLVSNEKLNEVVDDIWNSKEMDDKAKAEAERLIKKKYYATSVDDFRAAIVEKYATKAKSRIEKIRKHAPKPKPSEKDDDTEESKGKDDADAKKTGRHRPPSTTSTSDKVDTGKKSGETPEEVGEKIIDRVFGR